MKCLKNQGGNGYDYRKFTVPKILLERFVVTKI